jgi:hypothetical protein
MVDYSSLPTRRGGLESHRTLQFRMLAATNKQSSVKGETSVRIRLTPPKPSGLLLWGDGVVVSTLKRKRHPVFITTRKVNERSNSCKARHRDHFSRNNGFHYSTDIANGNQSKAQEIGENEW